MRRSLPLLLLLLAVDHRSFAQSPTPPVQPTPDTPKPTEPAKTDGAWNVCNPPGPHADVAIDVREGTWMNLDVSPDGKSIAFDLLGDIYTMPISGGIASPLTGPGSPSANDMAWDMQPRFSPDGTKIAFTSDRGNGDNIWVMNADGTNLLQVTKETYRLLNSPAWEPGGQAIVARKHFTSRRSLGSGEMWLYHLGQAKPKDGGGDGLPLTTKPTDQKDVGEPAFSPDGRYLYYSWDATPGGSFEYSKDSTGQIYIISRLDRVKGETENWITGPGGAIRPTPSPDGKSLAFVRRSDFKTALFIQDIASGRVRMIHDQLERDMQETWAIHGVYPSIAWTPDSASIVYWATGKIWRVAIGTASGAPEGSITEIPFQVKSTRRVQEAVRFPIEVAPERFDVRMIKTAEVSPSGDAVAYQALGHIYVRSLPDGTPRRLTTDHDRFEFCPSWSRDGQFIVFTTWNDQEMGTLRVAPAAGGPTRDITTQPGIFVDPVFSPDGKRIVFGKVSGGYLLPNIYARETGVYVAPASGGEMKRLTKRGTSPHFANDPSRVFLVTSEPDKDNDNTKLISIGLDGLDEREHFKSANATEMRVSPDGQWLAWAERFNVYVTPFTLTGRSIEIGPASNNQPIARVSSDAGISLRWSGDSKQVTWTLGPELFRKDLHQAFAWLDPTTPNPTSAAEKNDDKPVGLNISFTHPKFVPKGHVAFVGGKIVTMRELPNPADPSPSAAQHKTTWTDPNPTIEILADGTLLTDGDRITAIGPRDRVQVPPDAFVVDCKGLVLTPGMIDVHAHGGQGQAGITPQQNWGQYANLAFGVTTIHDPSNDTEEIFAASELQKAGMIVAPRIFSTGTILYGATGSFKAEINSLDDALFHLRRMKAVGAWSVKSYNQPRRDQRQQVIEAARQLGMMVVPEGGSLLQHNLTMVVDGHTGVEHSLPCENIYQDIVQLWGASRTGYTPTLVVGYGGIAGENYWYDRTNVWENEKLLRFVPRQIVEPRSRRREHAPDSDYNTLRSARICKALNDAGITVHIGAHGQLPGLAAHWELWMLEQGGLSPLQAMRCATIQGARYLGLDRDLGSLEVGKLADIAVYAKDWTANLRNSDSVKYVMVGGRLYNAETMDEIGQTPRPRQPFHFERLLASIGYTGTFGACHGCGLPGCGSGVKGTMPAGEMPMERGYR
jgi:imidazolonepropionase-like amidohydrolase/Tol biopolymer transport system component